MFKAVLKIVETIYDSRAMVKKGDLPSTADLGEREISQGDELKLNGYGKNYLLLVEQVRKDLVVLNTDDLSAKEKGISLRPKPEIIELSVGQSIKLSTPTTDAGKKWLVTLVKIESRN